MNLKPRLHLKPVKYLIKGEFFEEEALENANEFFASLNKHVEKTVKDVRPRMKTQVEKKETSQLITEDSLII